MEEDSGWSLKDTFENWIESADDGNKETILSHHRHGKDQSSHTQVVRDLLQSGLQEEVDCSVACCDSFAQHFADKISHSHK